MSASSKKEEERDVVTQGTQLEQFYGEETATMYAGMMDEEVKKTIPDLKLLLQNVPSSGTILDTCVGSGHMLEWIHLQHNGNDHPLHGIDLSTDMLNQARKRLSSCEEGVVLGQANFLEVSSGTSIQPKSCAAILNAFGLHHVTAKQAEKAIQDWSVLLRDDGGCLYLGLWEGNGYMEEFPPGTKTLMHPEAKVNEWIKSAGLDIIMSRTQIEEEMGDLNTLYIICQKKKT